MARHIAIIGSGPAGCYLADQLLRLIPDAAVDIIEKLPVPFGLIRYGVAPDHQSTKAVARVLDRVLARDRVGYFGNVCVGRDVQVDELMSLYDAVVLATGAQCDRKLGIPGEDLPGVIGSGAFVGWYNGHPFSQSPAVSGIRSAVIIGNGNVAIDVARVLAKGPEELAGSDLPPQVTEWLGAQPLEAIHIVGRRSAAEAKFTTHELAELGTLQRAQPTVMDPAGLSGDSDVVKTLRGFAESIPRATPVTINFHFQLTPVAFTGEGKLEGVQFRRAAGGKVEIPAQLSVTCIGYDAVACGSALPQNGTFRNDAGRIDPRLYVAGWARRGPSGTIPTNRTEGQQLAQKIAQEIADGVRAGRRGLRELLESRDVGWTDYAAWRRMDEAELAGACAERCRQKLGSVDEMLEAALEGQLRSA
ncbi:MAG TPA: FAD-dependent oxidoreductase [Candidatus Binatia bacterium]|nr:FAD-dependent oxidoreductase [Candidatus Binatia bacterium]